MTEFVEILKHHEAELCVAVFLTAMFLYGYHRGGVRMVSGILSFLLMIILSRVLYPFVLTKLTANETLMGMIRGLSEKLLHQTIKNTISQDNLLQIIIENIEKTDEYQAFLSKISTGILTILTMLLLLFVIQMIISLFHHFLSSLSEHTPLSSINHLIGGILGLFHGIFWLWILELVLLFIPSEGIAGYLRTAFHDNASILYIITRTNFFLFLLARMIN